MNANDVREFVHGHPDGVVIRMIDGYEYEIRHRDWVWFPPVFGHTGSRAGRYASSFGVYHNEALRLVNCMLVAEIVPLKKNGNGHGRKPGRRAK